MQALSPVAALLIGAAILLTGQGLQGTLVPVRAGLVDFSTIAIAAIGFNKDNWGAELFFDNITDEEAAVAQTVGKFTPEVTVQRPRTV